MLNLLTAFCNFYRQENCYRCLHVYLSVPDCCATGRERSPEWGWRDDKVQPHKFWHLDVQTRSHKGDMLQIQYCSSWMDPRLILGSRLKYIFFSTACCLSQPPDGNVLPDDPDAGTRHQTSVCVWWQAPTAQISRGLYGLWFPQVPFSLVVRLD